MVWFQIIAVTIASGIWLYYIERENEPHKRKLKYVPFLVCMPLFVSILSITQQFYVSEGEFRTGIRDLLNNPVYWAGMLELFILSLVLAIEAIYVAKLARKVTWEANIFLFMPVYIVGIWLVSFFTLLLMLLIHPGS